MSPNQFILGRSIFLLLLSLLWSQSIQSRTIKVDSKKEFQQIIHQALPNDTILILDGEYTNWNVSWRRFGPLRIEAENYGKVIFSGNTSFQIQGRAIFMAGFVFRNITSDTSIVSFSDASRCRISNIRFENCRVANDTATLVAIKGICVGNRIDHSMFINNNGKHISIDINSEHSPKLTRVDHNVFRNNTLDSFARHFPLIEIGDANHLYSRIHTYTLIAQNTFQSIGIQPCIISNTSSNTIMKNIFGSCYLPVNINGGIDCRVMSNTLENCNTGIALAGKTHEVYHNLLVRCDNGVILHSNGAKHSDTTKQCIISNNTLVNTIQNGLSLGIKSISTNETEVASPFIINNYIINNLITSNHGVLFDDIIYRENVFTNNLLFAKDEAKYGGDIGNNLSSRPVFKNPEILDYSLIENSPGKHASILLDTINMPYISKENDIGVDLNTWHKKETLFSSAFEENLTSLSDMFWTEGSYEWSVEDGSVQPKETILSNTTRRFGSVWLNQELQDDIQITITLNVKPDDTSTYYFPIYFMYQDPNGFPLPQTREERAKAGKEAYYENAGYSIQLKFHFRDKTINFSLCDNPGNHSIIENYIRSSSLQERYLLTITKVRNNISLKINGRIMLMAQDDLFNSVHERGYLGFGTSTKNIAVEKISIKKIIL